MDIEGHQTMRLFMKLHHIQVQAASLVVYDSKHQESVFVGIGGHAESTLATLQMAFTSAIFLMRMALYRL